MSLTPNRPQCSAAEHGTAAVDGQLTAAPGAVVIDTNIVLDLFVFDDEAARALRAALEAGHLRWLSTAHMREELQRVLGYAQIVPRLAYYALTADDVLAHFDRLAHGVPPAPKTSITCSDADDQCFIDLAVAHGAQLLSKDRAVLAMKRRLALLGVAASTRWAPPVPA